MQTAASFVSGGPHPTAAAAVSDIELVWQGEVRKLDPYRHVVEVTFCVVEDSPFPLLLGKEVLDTANAIGEVWRAGHRGIPVAWRPHDYLQH